MARTAKSAAKHSAKITKPAVLKAGHDVAKFDCGRDQINDWLRQRAKKAVDEGTARTFVVCRGSKRVVGFHALAAGAADHASVPGRLRRNTPDPIPIIVLARLGVDRSEQRQGLGEALLNDAMRRALHAARYIGARALLVHALDASAAKFYKSFNFAPLTEKEKTFFISMKEIRDSLS